MAEEIFPTWGYKIDAAQIFDLRVGEKLPAGWSYTPVTAETAPEPIAEPVAVEPEPQPEKRKPGRPRKVEAAEVEPDTDEFIETVDDGDSN